MTGILRKIRESEASSMGVETVRGYNLHRPPGCNPKTRDHCKRGQQADHRARVPDMALLALGSAGPGRRARGGIDQARRGRRGFFFSLFFYIFAVGFVPKWVGGSGSGGPHGRARGGSDARWPGIPMSWCGCAKISLIMGCTHG
jgi:hypothetical protein